MNWNGCCWDKDCPVLAWVAANWLNNKLFANKLSKWLLFVFTGVFVLLLLPFVAAANAAAYNDSNGDFDNQLDGSKNDGTLFEGDENKLAFCCWIEVFGVGVGVGSDWNAANGL